MTKKPTLSLEWENCYEKEKVVEWFIQPYKYINFLIKTTRH